MKREFDPSLKIAFPCRDEPKDTFCIAGRELFYRLIQPDEVNPPILTAYAFIQARLDLIKLEFAEQFSPDYLDGSLASLTREDTISGIEENAVAQLTPEFFRQYAPIFFTELAWLATISQTINCQQPVTTAMTALFLRLTQSDQTPGAACSAYSGALHSEGIHLPPLHSLAFSQQTGLTQAAFDLAATQLALSRFPRILLPEILGFTLAYCQNPTLASWFKAETSNCPAKSTLLLREQRRLAENPVVSEIVNSYLSENQAHVAVLWPRIQSGFWLYHQLRNASLSQIIPALHLVPSPRQRMIELLGKLIPAAIGHHGHVLLDGKTIDDWFRETPFPDEKFLACLLRSPLVDIENPERSKLLKLFEFGGPMFGVMDENAYEAMKNWLLSETRTNVILDSPRSQPSVQAEPEISTRSDRNIDQITSTVSADQTKSESSQPPQYSSLGNRELFHYLIHCDCHPGVLPTARERVERVLTWSRLFNRPPFRDYSHEKFTDHIGRLYQNEVRRYRPVGKPKLEKADYVWGIEQFAPTILTDGSWLQAMSRLDFYPNYRIGDLLQKIYADEIGNGIVKQNHPHIYQALLDSLDIVLPPLQDSAFIQHPGFITGAFDIPVYLMAIAQFPSTFLPELLGLNMAIELSGLGNQYLRLSEALRYWGINSAIVDVHTSIDNLASGHSSLAMEAIRLYLDDILAQSGVRERNAHWLRIHTGYRSLQTCNLRFTLSLLSNYYLKRAHLHNKYN